MSRENVTRPISASELAELLSIFERTCCDGEENLSLDDFAIFTEEKRENLIGGEAGSLLRRSRKPQ
jgi:hypothetical protein